MPSGSSCLLLVLSPGLEFTDDTRNVFLQVHEVSKIWMSFKYTTLGEAKRDRTSLGYLFPSLMSQSKMKHLGLFQIGMKCFRFVTVEKICVGKISTGKTFDTFIYRNF